MDIINKIEIKHFRSFDGGKDQPKVIIHDLKDFNIFSGANDSGKSNVLRALNLFFNDEISPGLKFDKNRDFSKIVSTRFDEDIKLRKEQEAIRIKEINEKGWNEKPKDLRRSDVIVSIKLYFNNVKRQRALPESFWVSKTFSQKNNFQGEFTYQSILNKAQTTAFLKSFQFEYIPAIKDRNFFNHLFSKLQAYLFEKGDKAKRNKFKESSDKFNVILRNETTELFNKFFESSGVSANFHIPSTLVDFFRTLSVQTENEISLFDRGDGVQARFIPEILDEISKGSNKNIIWGFEEPENSYEAKNIRKLKEEFQNRYSRNYQIFITTHTKEFLATKRIYTEEEEKILTDKKLNTLQKKNEALSKLPLDKISSAISIYRVWKSNEANNTSLITHYNESNNAWDEICDDLGIIQEARIIDQLQEKIDAQLKQIQDSELNLSQQGKVITSIQDDYLKCLEKLNDAESRIEEYLKPILVVEDKYEGIYKLAFLKINNISCTKDNINEIFSENCPFIIRRAGGTGGVTGFLCMNMTDGYDDKKVIGLYDYDEEGCRNFYLLSGKANGAWNNEILGDKQTGFYKKRIGHASFFALILPVPVRLSGVSSDVSQGVFTSHVEIENLLPIESLIELSCVETKEIMGNTVYKIKNTIKSKSVEKFIEIPNEKFEDFKPLFNKINDLFN